MRGCRRSYGRVLTLTPDQQGISGERSLPRSSVARRLPSAARVRAVSQGMHCRSSPNFQGSVSAPLRRPLGASAVADGLVARPVAVAPPVPRQVRPGSPYGAAGGTRFSAPVPCGPPRGRSPGNRRHYSGRGGRVPNWYPPLQAGWRGFRKKISGGAAGQPRQAIGGSRSPLGGSPGRAGGLRKRHANLEIFLKTPSAPLHHPAAADGAPGGCRGGAGGLRTHRRGEPGLAHEDPGDAGLAPAALPGR